LTLAPTRRGSSSATGTRSSASRSTRCCGRRGCG
jgi:hypothetical protein